jgi:hypothetical protein
MTASSIPSLSLSANETKVIFYNRPFWVKRSEICNALFSSLIRFLDDENTAIVRKNPDYSSVVDDQYTNPYVLNSMFSKMNTDWDSSEEAIIELEEEAGRKILTSIKGFHKRKVDDGTVTGYPRSSLIASLGTIVDKLRNGELIDAATSIALIPNDNFWNNARRTRFIDLCNSVNLI